MNYYAEIHSSDVFAPSGISGGADQSYESRYASSHNDDGRSKDPHKARETMLKEKLAQ